MFIIDVVYERMYRWASAAESPRLRPMRRPLTVRINNQIPHEAACPAVVKPIDEDEKIKYSSST